MGLAKQTQAALGMVGDAVRMARGRASNPAAALARVSSLPRGVS
jgi:hypothetical protein